jgi:hypothetical protein
MYELGGSDYLRAALASAVVSLPLGFLGAVLLPPRPFAGLFSLAFALLLGLGAGAAVSEAMTRATSGKRGTTMQLIAVAGVAAAVGLRLLIGGDLALVTRDVAGALMGVVGAVQAWNRLR